MPLVVYDQILGPVGPTGATLAPMMILWYLASSYKPNDETQLTLKSAVPKLTLWDVIICVDCT